MVYLFRCFLTWTIWRVPLFDGYVRESFLLAKDSVADLANGTTPSCYSYHSDTTCFPSTLLGSGTSRP
jgi:hypothetical protein